MDNPMTPNDAQHGTINPSGLAAPISTFHKFTSLAPELRIMIWKAACRPRTTTECGLHYVHLDTVEGGWDYDNPEFDETRFAHFSAFKRLSDDPIRGTTSAYLWDAGLWTACKESRLAIAEHHEFHSWSSVQPPTNWSNPNFPLRLNPHVQDRDLITMVFPNKDILCIRNDSPMTVNVDDLLLKGLSIDARRKVTVDSWSVALEFKSSWLNHPSELPDWDSLNAIVNWVETCIEEERHVLPNLWLIDYNVQWNAMPDHEYDTLYRTCDDEYLHVSWESIETTGTKPAVLEFVDRLDCLFVVGRARERLKLLVRKANKLSEESASDTSMT
ncbi:hypothetical protein FIE12Z_8233 [Fusarium flagelliforme]|uniref:2EXR domain-containing protein n=1 Tax=Fusarium flagelliforme TaxID=2675880 RepID=A0A395MI41_9HYPO|nr:hypothetical protein FIE12Z_8233 [Fusarium flagelliforme]